MNKTTSFVCDDQAKIKYVFNDDLGIVLGMSNPSIFMILDPSSLIGFSLFLQSIKRENYTINWTLKIKKGTKTQSVFFSGFYWMRQFLLQISSEPVAGFFIIEDAAQNREEYAAGLESGGGSPEEKLSQISQLNRELIRIQRELTKKNRQLELMNERLGELATTDSLTGIYNRRAILERAKTELERAHREGRFFSLAILDLDNFKQINDIFGHQKGDEALTLFAQCLEKCTRKYDAVGRLGGDEFLIFFSLDHKSQFVQILERIQLCVREITLDSSKQNRQNLTASIGGVFVSQENGTKYNIEEIIRQADKTLYAAKNHPYKDIIVNDL